MRLDYWNDPLVVSAFRVRFRGSGPSIVAATYFLALVTTGGILHHYLAADPNVSWVQVYFVVLISVEVVITGLFAMMATWQSMHAEVVNRTLDYQRIAAIAPRDILLGKLVGEPAQGYLMGLAGLPLLAWCWGMGAVSLEVLVLLIVQVFTTAILLGTLGLVHPMDTGGDKSKMSSRTIRNVALIIFGVYAMQVSIFMSIMGSHPLTQVPLGMLTPVFSITAVAREMPNEYGLPFFTWHVPWLFLTPVSQLAIAAIILHSITRRLISPVNVALGKPIAYVILVAIDVIVIGAMLDPRTIPPTLEARFASFCLAHVVASLLMALAVTPNRECLKTWLWRLRGRQAWWKDALVGERSENLGALVAFCVLGIAAAMLLVSVPAGALGAPADLGERIIFCLPLLGTMCLLILAVGSLYQLLVSIGSAGATIFVGFVAMIVIVPHMSGAYLQIPELMAASPSAQFAHWIAEVPPSLPLLPLVAVYGTILVVAQYVLRQRIKKTSAAVGRIIAGMLAEPVSPEAVVAGS
jgi:hypothetical protein